MQKTPRSAALFRRTGAGRRMVSNGQLCQQHQRSNQREPLGDRRSPTQPWQIVTNDFFHLHSVTYLLVVDYFSKYIVIEQKGDTSAIKGSQP